MYRPFAVCAMLSLPTAALGFEPIKSKSAFLETIEGRELRIGLYGLTLKVSPKGTIEGRALGGAITGSWAWQDGYFCREMAWSGRPIPYNCQLVEQNGAKLRFTTDKGAGDSAAFDLR